jgi:ribosomal protein L4
LNINGTQLDSSNELLNVLEASGNYLLHKDILRHFNSQRQGTVSTKLVAKFEVVVVNHGVSNCRARAGSNIHLWKGGGVTLDLKPRKVFLKLNKKERRLVQTLLYNKKKKNILIIENLENEITEPKQRLLKVCKDCDIRSVLVIVSKKTTPLKVVDTKS